MSDFAGSASSDDIKQRYLSSLGEDYGEFVLGKNTTRILHEDPKLLLFTLARYKFVSKMLNGCGAVLEVGCQEGFGAMLVSKVVKRLHAVDFYVPYIASCNRRIRATNIVFEARDMLDGPIDGPFDGAYALDVLEHIQPQAEDLFMGNIVRSMGTYGTLILGMPSRESQCYASEASRAGHVNCKSGPELASFAGKYFLNVFSFSMNDEVLHTGFYAMSHYLFVVCSNRRE